MFNDVYQICALKNYSNRTGIVTYYEDYRHYDGLPDTCLSDRDEDGDVDGVDLSLFAASPVPGCIADLAADFGEDPAKK